MINEAKKYREGDMLTFANGNIGCVTKFDTVVVTDKSGWTTKAHRAPDVFRYTANNAVIKVERSNEPRYSLEH